MTSGWCGCLTAGLCFSFLRLTCSSSFCFGIIQPDTAIRRLSVLWLLTSRRKTGLPVPSIGNVGSDCGFAGWQAIALMRGGVWSGLMCWIDVTHRGDTLIYWCVGLQGFTDAQQDEDLVRHQLLHPKPSRPRGRRVACRDLKLQATLLAIRIT